MRKSELNPAWVHGVALAICFFGWIGLAVYFDGVVSAEQVSRALSQAILFTTLMAAVDLGMWAYRR